MQGGSFVPVTTVPSTSLPWPARQPAWGPSWDCGTQKPRRALKSWGTGVSSRFTKTTSRAGHAASLRRYTLHSCSLVTCEELLASRMTHRKAGIEIGHQNKPERKWKLAKNGTQNQTKNGTRNGTQNRTTTYAGYQPPISLKPPPIKPQNKILQQKTSNPNKPKAPEPLNPST